MNRNRVAPRISSGDQGEGLTSPSPAGPFALAFSALSVTLDGHSILKEVTAEVPAGGCTAVVGPNGAGKTTLLLALLGQVSYRGRVQFPAAPPRIGYVMQRLQFEREMPITVLEFLAMGRQRLPLCFGVGKPHRERAMMLLESVKAEDLWQRRLGALSGGEMQRVLLALALDQDPQLLVLDEPAAGVDVRGEQVFCELLERLRLERGYTQLMVTHDLALVTHHATHVICLNRSVVAQGSPREVLTPTTLTALFGLHMGLVSGKGLPEGRTDCASRCCQPEDRRA